MLRKDTLQVIWQRRASTSLSSSVASALFACFNVKWCQCNRKKTNSTAVHHYITSHFSKRLENRTLHVNIYHEWQHYCLQLFTMCSKKTTKLPSCPMADKQHYGFYLFVEKTSEEIWISILDLICSHCLRLGVQPRGSPGIPPTLSGDQQREMCNRMEISTLSALPDCYWKHLQYTG